MPGLGPQDGVQCVNHHGELDLLEKSVEEPSLIFEQHVVLYLMFYSPPEGFVSCGDPFWRPVDGV